MKFKFIAPSDWLIMKMQGCKKIILLFFFSIAQLLNKFSLYYSL